MSQHHLSPVEDDIPVLRHDKLQELRSAFLDPDDDAVGAVEVGTVAAVAHGVKTERSFFLLKSFDIFK